MLETITGQVKNKVITAYLQAFYDLLDYDGMKSILIEAGLLELKDNREVDPQATIELNVLKQIISAQDLLLFGCDDLLCEIGKKFAFYLFPYGKSLTDIINELKLLIQTNWSITISHESEKEMDIEVENCIFCPDIEQEPDLFIGFIEYSLQKSLPTQKKVSYNGKVIESSNKYTIRFKIEDIN